MNKPANFWFVYILADTSIKEEFRDAKGSRYLYTGITNDVNRRLAEHNASKVKSTTGGTWVLVAQLVYTAQCDAALVERWLKVGRSREKKQKCIDRFSRGLMNARFCNFALAHASEWNHNRQERWQAKQEKTDAPKSRPGRNSPVAQSTQP